MLGSCYRLLFPIPAPVVRTMTPLDIALTLGWDLDEDSPDVTIGAPLPTDLVTRPANAPSPRKRRRKQPTVPQASSSRGGAPA